MRVALLEQMARDLVGDGKSPNLYFVVQSSNVVCVTPNKDIARAVANALGEAQRVIIEDRRTGNVWEN